jgi:AcrR family transcriptional regulator
MPGREVDGRTARRQKNRDAVLDAVVAIFEDGVTDPSIDDVAERAGVSARSVYRYFADRDDLLQSAMWHAIARVLPTMQLDHVGVGSFEERCTRFVEHRIEMYIALAPITRAAKRAAQSEPEIAEQFETGRFVLRQQFLDQFSPEFEGLNPAERTRIAIVAELPFQFESFEFLWASCNQCTDDMRAMLVDYLFMALGRLRSPNGSAITSDVLADT